MFILKKFYKAVTAVVFLSGFSTVGATVINGTFNDHGYDVININVASPSNVDFLYTSGYKDAAIALFNAAGDHLVTNDDAETFNPRLTSNLSAGNYSLLVTYCCNMLDILADSSFATTDGFNSGSYWFGGSASLANAESYLKQFSNVGGSEFSIPAGFPYQLNLTYADVRSANVPEPQTVFLFALALGALALTRFRGEKGA